MFSERSTATSSRMLAKFSSVTIAPSMLMTNVFSRNRGMYWRMPRRSVSFTWVLVSVYSGHGLAQRSDQANTFRSAARQRVFSAGVPTEMRIHSGS